MYTKTLTDSDRRGEHDSDEVGLVVIVGYLQEYTDGLYRNQGVPRHELASVHDLNTPVEEGSSELTSVCGKSAQSMGFSSRGRFPPMIEMPSR